MIDSHCHLTDAAFVPDLSEVVARARGAGLSAALSIVDAGDDEDASRAEKVRLAWPQVRFAAGVHPHTARRFDGRLQELAAVVRARLAALNACAVGEIGLDYHYDLSPRDVQRIVFARQIALARELHLPVIIHTREAEADTLAVLMAERASEVGGVLHCFSSRPDLARRALDLGFYVSFAGILTFPKGDTVREVARFVPLDRVLVETDCPYLAPVPHRGGRNEPAWVVHVAATLASLHRIDSASLEPQLDSNFETLFGRPERLGNGRGATVFGPSVR